MASSTSTISTSTTGGGGAGQRREARDHFCYSVLLYLSDASADGASG
eukprot:COSAG01_NODE_76781_length_177_cov_134.961538_1_plen_46_part_01